MKEKLSGNTKIIILILGIMLTIIGVTYSFVAPLISGVETESTISFGSGMIKITYTGSNVITGENIIPGWSDTKEFTVVGYNNTTVNNEDLMDYAIKLVVKENTFTDGAIRYELTGSSTNDNDTLSPLFGKIPTGTGATLVGTARFSQDDNIKNNVTHTYSLKIGFPNRNSVNQNEDMNKTFKGYIIIEEGNLQLPTEQPMLLSEYIEKTYNGSFNSTSTIEEDDFGNLRYVGATPNNYITFNDETWRIIGIVDDGVKIIRQDRIEDEDGNNTFQWNSKGEYNIWNSASLKEYLNVTYYNNLTATVQEQIQERIWKLGGIDVFYSQDAAYMYIQEGGTKVYRPQATRWTGNIALAYPSDWAYLGYNQNSWLYISQTESKIDESKYEEWLLSNAAYSSYGVFYVQIGYLDFSVRSEKNVYSNSISVRPESVNKSV